MKKAKILIVEDNNIVMLELKDRLTEMEYNVVDTALSGLEAVKKAGIHKPDLALMDIRLKGEMDGIDAAAIIRKEYDVPIIYLTAHTDDDTLQRAKITEPYGYIIKPFEERELRSTIEMALYKHKAEKVLKDNVHWLSATLKSIGDALIATDSSGIIKLVNPIAEEITGWHNNEAFNLNIKDVFKVIEEDSSELLENPITISLKNNVIVGAANKILLTKNGDKIPIDYSSAPIRDTSELTSGAVLVFRDISEKKRAKELIEKQKIFLRQIIDTDPNFISVKDSKGKYELINKTVADALGTTTEELEGKYDEDYFSSDEIIRQRKIENDVIQFQQEIVIPEEKLIDAKGKIHLLQTFKRAINSQEGDKKLVLSVASDITELKLTENALRESEKRINTLFKAIPDIVLRYKRDGTIIDYHIQNPDSLFPDLNKIIGEKVYDILDDNLGKKIHLLSEKAIETYEVQIFEFESDFENTTKYKEVRIVNNADDELIIIFRDITSLKLSEQELKDLNASKDKFFSIIAHDLRSPFTSLIGLTEHLVDEVETITKEDLRQISENILNSSKTTLNLLENLLQWARIKTGRINYNPKEINLNELFNRIQELYRHNSLSKNISLNISINSNNKVFADQNMLETIIRNLISNSVKFTHAGGRIDINYEDEGEFAKINVKDTGVGISERKLETLFQIDKNHSTNGTQQEEGSGLGLILCKEFIEINKGRIFIESQIGKGSIFSFTIPKKEI